MIVQYFSQSSHFEVQEKSESPVLKFRKGTIATSVSHFSTDNSCLVWILQYRRIICVLKIVILQHLQCIDFKVINDNICFRFSERKFLSP